MPVFVVCLDVVVIVAAPEVVNAFVEAWDNACAFVVLARSVVFDVMLALVVD